MPVDPAALSDAALRPIWHAATALPDAPAAGDIARLRERSPDTPTDVIAEIAQQTLLRRAARVKLGAPAAGMFFTRTGLEQSSRPAAAMRRAGRIAALGYTNMYDLGCGVGVDALAARRCGITVVAVESDPQTAAVAAANLGAGVVCGDATATPVPHGAVVFVDPARRRGHRTDGSPVRTSAPDRWEPPWSWVERTAARHPATVAKVAPGIPHSALPPDGATEWISVDGHLVEAAVWFAGLSRGLPRRSAVVLRSGSDPWNPCTETILGSDHPEPAAAGPLGDWLLEPDPAIIRSGLVDVACARAHGRLVSPGIAYITADDPPPAVLGRTFRIEAVLPARPKALRRELRRRSVSAVTIRTRGLGLDPDSLRRDLRLPAGGRAAELVLTRVRRGAVALLVQPVTP